MTERVVMALKELPFDVSQWERFKAVIGPDGLCLSQAPTRLNRRGVARGGDCDSYG